jgi:hypothetical protein
MLQLAPDKARAVMRSEQYICFCSQPRQKHGFQAGAVNALDLPLGVESAVPKFEAATGNIAVTHFGECRLGSWRPLAGSFGGNRREISAGVSGFGSREKGSRLHAHPLPWERRRVGVG